MANVLVVDDDPGVLFALEELMIAQGHTAVVADSARAALAALDGVDVVITDFAMPDKDGLALLDELRAIDPALPVILITAHGSERTAVRAMKHGAYDYLAKPFDNGEVKDAIARAYETRRLRVETRDLALERTAGARIIGQSPAMTRLVEAALRVAARDVTVLVRGETGTGKELIASLLHGASARAAGPLVAFNSAAIPSELAEAQLFGHARGAFTGAVERHEGYIARASGGTLFLDEIGELSPAVQAKLLRVLQDGEIQPVGAARVEHVDVRVVAATHRDLRAEVAAGRFREDLYYRLAVVELVVPPLRERTQDIALLAGEFARKYSERFGLGYLAQLSDELLAQLEIEPWPGNVRQLENTVARMVAMAPSKLIGVGALRTALASHGALPTSDAPSFREQVEAFERNLIHRALGSTAGNQARAARRLGMTRASLYDKMRKYRIGSR